MAFSHISCLVAAAVLLFVIGAKGDECFSGLQSCMENFSNPSKAGTCKAMRKASACLDSVVCAGETKVALDAAKEQLKTASSMCGGDENDDGCSESRFFECTGMKEMPTDEKEACAIWTTMRRCADELKKSCKNEKLQKMMQGNEEQLKMIKEKCIELGYDLDGDNSAAVSKPSIIFVVASALMLALRLHL